MGKRCRQKLGNATSIGNLGTPQKRSIVTPQKSLGAKSTVYVRTAEEVDHSVEQKEAVQKGDAPAAEATLSTTPSKDSVSTPLTVSVSMTSDNDTSDDDTCEQMKLTEERKFIYHRYEEREGYNFAHILNRDIDPEGVGIDTCKMGPGSEGVYAIDNSDAKHSADDGHVCTLLSGKAELKLTGHDLMTFDASIHPVHIYIPPTALPAAWVFKKSHDVLKLKHLYGKSNGTEVDVRNERFVRGTGRFILTPQYTSRRIFTYGDRTILSRYDDSVSWFRTSMFCTKGLPMCMDDKGGREERLASGEPHEVLDKSVFKMQYDFGTEPNCCYDVRGEARVRFAKHPYGDLNEWHAWSDVNSDSCYYVNEARDGPEVEFCSENGEENVPKRNRHEVWIKDHSVSLMCLFDPGCTGQERHRVGAYSGYRPQDVYGTTEYQQSLIDNQYLNDMVNKLSMHLALNPDADVANVEALKKFWDIYAAGFAIQYAQQLSTLEENPSRKWIMEQFAMDADL